MKSLLNKLPSLLAFVYTVAMCADSQPTHVKKEPMKNGYTAPCSSTFVNDTQVHTSASFIFWQPIQENMQLGVVSDVTATDDLANGYEVPLQENFRPGLKLGLGIDFNYDNWDTALEYTWFNAKESAHVSLDPANTLITLLPAWQIPTLLSPEYSAGSESWNLIMNLLDWNVGRACSIGNKLCIRPFMGMRAAFIKQTLSVDYLTQNGSFVALWPSTHLTLSTNSWGLGPEIGAVMNWELGAGFTLIGIGEWDILYTQYNLKNTQKSDTSSANVFTFNWNDMDTLRMHTNLELGLGWGTPLKNGKYSLDFLFNYCFQVFFNQNMFRNTFSTFYLGSSTVPNGNLYLQGLTVTCKLGF